jgi:hypothetical protein
MTKAADLIIGQVYFMATYHDPALRQPIIISYQYLGRDVHGAPANPADSGFHFRFLPPFHTCDPDTREDPDPCETLHWFSEEQVSSLLDIDELILELRTTSAVGDEAIRP